MAAALLDGVTVPHGAAVSTTAGHMRGMLIASLIAAVISLLILSQIFLPLDGWYDRHGYALGRDFSNFWLGGRLALTGRVAEIYDLPRYMLAMRGLFSPDQQFMNFSYPPHALALLVPFGALPYGLALPVWLVLSGAALFAAKPGTLRPWPWQTGLLLAVSPAVLFMLSIGQATALLAFVFVAGLRLIDKKPVLAGLLFGLLSVKPHLGLLLPFVLLQRRAWLTIAVACATVAALVAISLIVFGIEPWQAYIANTLPYQTRVIATPFGFVWSLMVSPYAWYAKLGAGFSTAMTLHVLTAIPLAVLALMAYAKARKHDEPLAIAILATASIAIVPYSLNYDLVIPVVAIAAWLATRTAPLPRATALALGIFWVLPVIGQVLYLADIYVLWPALGCALAALLRDAFVSRDVS
jgi:Glycosyltransferase family 87